MDVERVRYLPQHLHRRIPSPAFDAANVGQVDPSFMRELLLRELPLDAQAPHVRADDLPPVHCPRGAPGGSDGLGTIIPVFR